MTHHPPDRRLVIDDEDPRVFMKSLRRRGGYLCLLDVPCNSFAPGTGMLCFSLQKGNSMEGGWRRAVIGEPRDFRNPATYHAISLVALLAWVGLGADGLSSSAYGPDEAFRALGEHAYLAVALALATALTVTIISVAYSQIIKHFPFGGGGYVVATELLGPRWGVVSGAALLVDYVLTIAVSIAAGADQVFSVLPSGWHRAKLAATAAVILLLVVLNLRGVKESVTVLAPIF